MPRDNPYAAPRYNVAAERPVAKTMREVVIAGGLRGAKTFFKYAVVALSLIVVVALMVALGIAIRAEVSRGIDPVRALGGAGNILMYCASALGVIIFGSLYCAIAGGLLMGFIAGRRFRRHSDSRQKA
jgi:hypothetical protein